MSKVCVCVDNSGKWENLWESGIFTRFYRQLKGKGALLVLRFQNVCVCVTVECGLALVCVISSSNS